MKVIIFLTALILCSISFANVCKDRQKPVSDFLQKYFNKDCASISLEDLKNIRDLNLENLQLTSITANDLKDMNNLEELSIAYNNISKLDEDLLKHNPLLEYFYAFENKISNIPEHFFYSTPDLIAINISNNNLQSIPEYLILNLSELSYLNLSDNKNIKKIPENLLEGVELNIFACINCGLDSLPTNAIDQFYDIYNLYLDENNLKEFPDFKMEWTDLIVLNHNQLTKIPKFSGKTEEIYITNNPITEISIESFPLALKVDLLVLESLPLKKFDLNAFKNLVPNYETKIKIKIKNCNLSENTQKQLVEMYSNKIDFEFL